MLQKYRKVDARVGPLTLQKTAYQVTKGALRLVYNNNYCMYDVSVRMLRWDFRMFLSRISLVSTYVTFVTLNRTRVYFNVQSVAYKALNVHVQM